MTAPPSGPAEARTHARTAGPRAIRLGAVTIVPLVQFHYRVPPRRLFPDLTSAALDPRHWYRQAPFCEDGRLVIDVGGFLVRTPRTTLLVDAGVGDAKPRPNPCFHDRADDWLSTLRTAGVEPTDVDTVVFTHLHVDHVGYATTAGATGWAPTFPRARHLTIADELAFWTGPAAAGDRGRLGDYLADSVLPLREAGVLETVAPDEVIDEHVRLRPAPGHTPGNVCVEVQSDGRRAVFAGDVVHHALQLAYPELSTDFCVDARAARDSRIALLAAIADRDVLLVPSHFPHALPGHVVTDPAGGYRYETVTGDPL